jgi:uncharacterized membrane protein
MFREPFVAPRVRIDHQPSSGNPMTFQTVPATTPPGELVQRYLLSFPVACFSLTVITDIAYWQTSNLLWLHFSEWLLFAGVVFGVLAGVVAGIRSIGGASGLAWLTILGWIAVLGLAILNSLIHTADGWTAVVPWGITTSILTLILMMVVALLSRRGPENV